MLLLIFLANIYHFTKVKQRVQWKPRTLTVGFPNCSSCFMFLRRWLRLEPRYYRVGMLLKKHQQSDMIICMVSEVSQVT